MKFRTTPIEVEAVQWHAHGDDAAVIRLEQPMDRACHLCGRPMVEHGWIGTVNGGQLVCPDDWLVTGVRGERFPCKPELFAQTYDAI